MSDLESFVEHRVCAWAENNGWLVRKTQYVGRRGCPDRLFVGYGHTIFMELKRPGGKPDPHQSREHLRFEEHGVSVYVVDSVEDGVAVLKFAMKHDKSQQTYL